MGLTSWEFGYLNATFHAILQMQIRIGEAAGVPIEQLKDITNLLEKQLKENSDLNIKNKKADTTKKDIDDLKSKWKFWKI